MQASSFPSRSTMDSCPPDPQDYVTEAVLDAAIYGIKMT